jgi:microcystin-dependent protein
MGKLYNLARMTTATTGTGTITLGSAVSGFLTFATAGVANGEVVSYAIEDGANREVGTGTYTSSGTTLSRTVITSTNSNAAISLSGSAQVFITPNADDLSQGMFSSGDVKPTARRTAPSGWLLCDASAVSRTTYAALFNVIVPSLGTFTVTIASPGVFTLTSHALVVGDRVYLTTTGALPTGLSANTIYYVVSVPTANTFTVSATEGGTAINTSGSQSGTHTIYWCPYGLGDGSTTFNVPDLRGRTPVGSSGSSGPAAVRALGQNDGVTVGNRRPQHRHTPHTHGIPTAYVYNGDGSSNIIGGRTPTTWTNTSNSADGGSGNANDSLDAPAYLTVNWLIKT